MFTRLLCLASLSAACLVTSGCCTADYRGASASVRSFSEVPRQPREVYVGLDWKFSLDRPTQYHAYASSAQAAATPAQSTVSTITGE